MAHAERPLSLPARTLNDQDPAVAEVLAKAKAQTGMIPNMYARMANAPGLLETYLNGYNAFRSGSGFTPAEQETVLLTISRVNGCTYCVAAHSTLADMNKVPAEVTDAIRDGKPLPDARLDALSTFTAAMVEGRGLPTADQVDAFLAAGFAETDILQVVLAVSVKTISNYTNHLFHTPVDKMFADRAWQD
ncbi:carboxymuconolactone decarboxylase family protein [Streptomyces chiangmaiensis]